jgi:hypothetical protein
LLIMQHTAKVFINSVITLYWTLTVVTSYR